MICKIIKANVNIRNIIISFLKKFLLFIINNGKNKKIRVNPALFIKPVIKKEIIKAIFNFFELSLLRKAFKNRYVLNR